MNKITELHPQQTSLSAAETRFDAWIAQQKNDPIFDVLEGVSWEDETWVLKKDSTLYLARVGEIHRATGTPYMGHWHDLAAGFFVSLINSAGGLNEMNAVTLTGKTVACRHLIDHAIDYGLTHISQIDHACVATWIKTFGYTTGGMIRGVLTALSEQDLIPLLSDPMGLEVAKDTQNTTGKNADKVPTLEELVAFAEVVLQLYHREGNPLLEQHGKMFDRMRFYAMVCMFYVVTPSRWKEPWLQSADLAVAERPLQDLDESERTDKDHDYYFGLRWIPSKKGDPLVKPVPPKMREIAQHAVEAVFDYTQPARDIAAQIKAEPGRIPTPKGYEFIEECRASGRITADEMGLLLGINKPCDGWMQSNKFKAWRKTLATATLTHNNAAFCYDTTPKGVWGSAGGFNHPTASMCFETFEVEWWEKFQAHWKKSTGHAWPIYSRQNGRTLEADEALMVQLHAAFVSDEITTPLFLEKVSQLPVPAFLKKSYNANPTFWELLKITLPNGAHPQLTTHQFRHWLNSLMQANKMSNIVIAKLSGRASVQQNVVYDGRNTAQRLEYSHEDQNPNLAAPIPVDEMTTDDLIIIHTQNKEAGMTVDFSFGVPSTEVVDPIQDGVDRMLAKHQISMTEIGYCHGDITSAPCPFAGASCSSCNRCLLASRNPKSIEILDAQIKGNQAAIPHLKKLNRELPQEEIKQHITHLESSIASDKKLKKELKADRRAAGTLFKLPEEYARLDGWGAAQRIAQLEAPKKELPNG